MKSQGFEGWSRRKFLGGLTVAGTAGILGLRPGPAAAEPPPETAKITLVRIPAICMGAQYVAEDLLRGEGFGEVAYVKAETSVGIWTALTSGQADISMHYAAVLVRLVDAGRPVVVLAGGHVGCFELFASERVRAIRDLKGKTVAVVGFGTTDHLLLSIMLAYVGLDPPKDVNWVIHGSRESAALLAEGKIDAFMGFPPLSQELKARKIGRVVFNSATDRPYSQYFCCMVAANAEFVRKHPVATKRALRAILKAGDLCALEPERAAHVLVDRGFVANYEYAAQGLREVNYAWRQYDPEDTLRFYALRLHEIGMVKATPQKIIERGTDWRFLNELKKELKG